MLSPRRDTGPAAGAGRESIPLGLLQQLRCPEEIVLQKCLGNVFPASREEEKQKYDYVGWQQQGSMYKDGTSAAATQDVAHVTKAGEGSRTVYRSPLPDESDR